jgi:hypothetical protein
MDYLQLHCSAQSYNQEISRYQDCRHHHTQVGIEPSGSGESQAGAKTLQFCDCIHFHGKAWSQPHCFILNGQVYYESNAQRAHDNDACQ